MKKRQVRIPAWHYWRNYALKLTRPGQHEETLAALPLSVVPYYRLK